MNCFDAIDLMDRALEGHVPSSTRPDFEAHLEECDPCRNYYAQLAVTVRALGRLPHEPRTPAADRREALRRAWRERTRPTDA